MVSKRLKKVLKTWNVQVSVHTENISVIKEKGSV